MTQAPETREIKAPEIYLFGLGKVTLTNTRESGEAGRAMLILFENTGEARPVGEPFEAGHPASPFPGGTEGEAAHPQGVTTTLLFENSEGLSNLILELITLHALRYPGHALPFIGDVTVARIRADRARPDHVRSFAGYQTPDSTERPE